MSGEIEGIEDFLGDAPPETPPEHAEPRLGGRGYGADDLQRRAAAITLAVLSGLALGVFGLIATANGSGDVAWLILSIVLLAGFVLLYKNFELAIVLFLCVGWVAVGTPTVATGGSGFGKEMLLSEIGLVSLLLVWATRVLARQDFKLYPTPMNVPILLFLAVCIWSTINGFLFPDPHVAANSVRQYLQVNFIDVSIRVLSLGGLLMVGNSLQGRPLRWAAIAILVPGIATYTNLLPFIPRSGWLVFPQVIAMALLTSFVVRGQGKLWMRICAAIVALSIVCSVVFVGTRWVSGWMAALVTLAVIGFLGNRRVFWIGLAVSGVVLLASWGYFYQHVVLDKIAGPDMDRFRMMRGAVMYASHFPLGIGLGNYRSYNSYYGRADVWNTTGYTSAHGTYSQALAETGWLGLLALLLLLAAGTRMLYRYYKVLPEGFAKSYALGALGSFVGISAASLWGDYLFPAYHNGGIGTFGTCVYVFLVIGIVIAMARENGIVWSQTARAPETESPAPAPLYNRGPYANTGSAAATPASGRR